jgi:Cu(I)/Ag(I) efflux system membrane fusion protein
MIPVVQKDHGAWAKTLVFRLGLGCLLAVAGCTKKPETSSSAAHLTAVSKVQEVKKELWTCPMHPQIKKDSPGSCPICGMNLVAAKLTSDVPAEAGAPGKRLPEGHAPFKLSLERRQMIGVRTGVVERKLLFKTIEAAGRVAFDPELYTSQNEYLEALKQVARVQDSPIAEVRHSAQKMLESAKMRLKILGLSDRQIKAISESGAAVGNLLIPKPGETLWVYAEIYEQDLPNIQSGMDAQLSGGSLGGRLVTGKVVSVDRVMNAATRTAKARISVPDAKALLRPEAFVDVRIRSPLGEQVTIPSDAVLDTGREAWVFVVKGDGADGDGGLFEPRRIVIKYRADDEVAVEEGVGPGERIVTSANFLIDSESRLKGVLAGQAEAPAVPQCPKGQVWHAEMKHCMPQVQDGKEGKND